MRDKKKIKDKYLDYQSFHTLRNSEPKIECPVRGRGYQVAKKLLGSNALGVCESPPETLDIVGLGLAWHTLSVLQDRECQSGRDQRVCSSYQGITLLCLPGNVSVTVPGEKFSVSLDSC